MTDWLERVKSDAGLRQTLQACRGTPLSVFLGRQVVTVHEYNVAGQMVRSTQEPLWTPDDRAAALALAAYEAGLCPGCHDPLEVTTKAENEGEYRATSLLCHRCVAMQQAAEGFKDHPHASALLFTAPSI